MYLVRVREGGPGGSADQAGPRERAKAPQERANAGEKPPYERGSKCDRPHADPNMVRRRV